MKKLLLTITILCASALFAKPQPPRPQPPRPPAHHHHHHDSFWGKGGRNFLPGFTTGLATGILLNKQPQRQVPVVAPQPVIVVQPKQVWIPGRFVDQVQPNGVIIRTWQPGHFEIIP